MARFTNEGSDPPFYNKKSGVAQPGESNPGNWKLLAKFDATKWFYNQGAGEYREPIPNDNERRKKQYLPRSITEALGAYPTTVNKTYLQDFDRRMGSDNVLCPGFAVLDCKNALSGYFCPMTHRELDFAAAWIINERRFPLAAEEAAEVTSEGLKEPVKNPCVEFFYGGGCSVPGYELYEHLLKFTHDPKDLLIIARKFFHYEIGDHAFEGLKAVLEREPPTR